MSGDQAPTTFDVSVDELKEHPQGGHGPPKDFLERQEELMQRKEEFQEQNHGEEQRHFRCPAPSEEDQ